MASDDTPQDGPSIAPPSLGLGFRRRKKDADAAVPVPSEPEAVDPPDEPEPEPEVVVEPEVEPEPGERPVTIFDAVPTVSTQMPVAVEPEPAHEPEPEPEPTQVISTIDDDPTVFTPLVVPAAAAVPTATAVETVEAPPRKPRRERTPRPSKPARAPKEPRPPRDLSLPAWLRGRAAAALTGLLVGLFIVAATALALRGCTAVRGTSSCGGGPGFFLLAAIVILAVLVGSVLLRLADVPGAGSTSFLAVGLTCVLSLLFLVDQLFDWWMVIAIPLISVATFVLSHWVSTSFSDTVDESA